MWIHKYGEIEDTLTLASNRGCSNSHIQNQWYEIIKFTFLQQSQNSIVTNCGVLNYDACQHQKKWFFEYFLRMKRTT